LGCGAVSQMLYVNALMALSDRIEVAGVADIRRSHAEAILHHFPSAPYFHDYNDLLQNLSFDAAIIALPHTLHVSAAIACMTHGVDVLMEKPMAVDMDGAASIVRTASRTGAIFSVGYFRRLFRACRAIKEIIDSGLLGRVIHFDFAEGEPYNWPAQSDSFFSRELAGGGVLMDAGAHTTDLMLWWFGDYESVVYRDDGHITGVESDLAADMVMKSGATGRLRISRSLQLPNKYRIECEHGWILWNCDDVNHFEMGTHNLSLPLDISLPVLRNPSMTFLEGRIQTTPLLEDYFTWQLDQFIDDVRFRRKPAIDEIEGSRNITFIEDCYTHRRRIPTPWRNRDRERAFMEQAGRDFKQRSIRNIAVVGSSGFIGSRLIEYLQYLDTNDFSLLPLTRRAQSGARLKSQGIRLHQADVMDRETLDHLLKGIDILFYAVVGDRSVIVRGLRNLLEAAARNHVKKIIYISTQMVFGFTHTDDLSDASIPRPERISWYPYSRDKADAERLIRRFRSTTSMDITIVRPGIVYGPYSTHWTWNIIEMILADRMFLVDGGKGACDTIFIDDLIESLLSCSTDRCGRNGTFNVSDGNRTTWEMFINTYCNHIGYPVEKIRIMSYREALNVLKDRSFLHRFISAVLKHRREIEAVITTLPFGNMIARWGSRFIVKKVSIDSENDDTVIHDRELISLQCKKAFLASKEVTRTVGWLPTTTLAEGIEKSVSWYTETR